MQATDFSPSPVRFALLGPPGPLINYVCVLLRHIVISEGLEDFHEHWPQNEVETDEFLNSHAHGNLLVGGQFPSPALLAWLERESIPTIVAVESPLRSTCWWMETFNVDYLVAVPAITNCLSLMVETTKIPRRVVITRDHARVQMRDFLLHLGRLCLGRTPGQIDLLMERLRVAPLSTLKDALDQSYFDAEDHPERLALSSTARREIDMVCSPLVGMVQGDAEEVEIQWPPSFFLDKSYTRPAAMVQELVGPARCLYYGPYLHLPRGDYSGEIAFGLSSEIRDTLLRVQVVCGDDTDEFIARARNGGLYTLPFDFSVADASKAIEVRLLMDRGEIEGRLGFAYVRIAPRAMS